MQRMWQADSMKVERDTKFQPVTITLETLEELQLVTDLVRKADSDDDDLRDIIYELYTGLHTLSDTVNGVLITPFASKWNGSWIKFTRK